MLREKLSYQSGPTDQYTTHPINQLMKNALGWTLGYGILIVGYNFLKDFFFYDIEYPIVIIESALLLIFLASIPVLVNHMGRTTVGYPAAAVVNDDGVKGDVSMSHNRAYRVSGYLGLIIGYFYALLLIILYSFIVYV